MTADPVFMVTAQLPFGDIAYAVQDIRSWQRSLSPQKFFHMMWMEAVGMTRDVQEKGGEIADMRWSVMVPFLVP